MCWQSGRDYPATAQTPAAGRHFVGSTIEAVLGSAANALREDCELVVSELLTNAVQAGGQRISLSLQLHHDNLRLTACDNGSGLPQVQRSDERDTSGRGLAIVRALAEEWAFEQVLGVTCVWARLAVAPALTTGLDCRLRTAHP